MAEERELGWDDVIENDGNDFIVAPPGDYDFVVVNLERERYQPGPKAKLPPCNMAKVTCRIQCDGEDVDIRHNLYLHSRCEGMLCAFFVGIGQRKHGEPLKPNWNDVIGRRGRCKVAIRVHEGREYNDIKKFYDPPKDSDTNPLAEPGEDF